MPIPEAKRTARIIEWRQLIHERQQGGQSVKAWCLQNGIRENRYYVLAENHPRGSALRDKEQERCACQSRTGKAGG